MEFWKLREIRTKVGEGKCPRCVGTEGVRHMSLSCQTREWRKKFLKKIIVYEGGGSLNEHIKVC